MTLPVDNKGDTAVSLSRLSPARQISTAGWQVYFSFGTGRIQFGGEYQRNPCIRSLQQTRTTKKEISVQVDIGMGLMVGMSRSEERTYEITRFPYPEAWNEVRRDEEDGASHDGNQASEVNAGEPQSERPERSPKRPRGIETRFFGVLRSFHSNPNVRAQPTYIVLGLFGRASPNPKERIVFVEKPDRLFTKLRWEAFRLRGVRGFFLSLKHLKGFRLYQCDAKTGIHKRITLDDNGIGDLQLLMSAYRQWHVPRHVSMAWSDWIHCTLNKNSLNVPEGEYGLELVLDWSVTRISIVVLIPVLLSLAIGIWLNSKAWTDLATIQTAWGTASYVVTAGALLAAMLGFLDIADK